MVVKESGHSYFYNDDGSTKFPFSWIDNPRRYKDMKREELSIFDREVVETLMKFNDKMPTKEGYKNDLICPCIYMKRSENDFAILAVYVDDINIIGTPNELTKAIDYL